RFTNGCAAWAAPADKEISSDPCVDPPAYAQAKLYAIADLPAATQRLMTRSWTRLQSGKEACHQT
ncbi:spermidine/putrescine ABC transporter substrate-binding protein PotF, partial [Pseudomonas syringae]